MTVTAVMYAASTKNAAHKSAFLRGLVRCIIDHSFAANERHDSLALLSMLRFVAAPPVWSSEDCGAGAIRGWAPSMSSGDIEPGEREDAGAATDFAGYTFGRPSRIRRRRF